MTNAGQVTAEQLVKRKYLGAFAHRSEGRRMWYIHYREKSSRYCPHCHNQWPYEELSLNILGSGGTSRAAWTSAAKKLGLP